MIKKFMVSAAIMFLGGSGPLLSAGTECGVVSTASRIELQSPAFVYHLSTDDGLRADSWDNRITGHTIDLGDGLELELDIDTADSRIWINGWRIESVQDYPSDPDKEKGYLQEFSLPHFDDSQWPGTQAANPEISSYCFPDWNLTESSADQRFFWTRTHVFLPVDAEGRSLSLTLGGFGLFDMGYMRVFVNGREVGVRNAPGRWNEPGVFDLGPGSAIYPHLRFGQDNIIAVQSTKYKVRTERMDKMDPQHMYHLIGKSFWPGQFEQYLTIGKPFHTPQLNVVKIQDNSDDDGGEVIFHLRSEETPIEAVVTYRWNAAQPILHKYVEVINTGPGECRLLNVRLGTYDTDADVSDGEQGFPVYLNGECFMSVVHPSGWAIGQAGQIKLRQYPAKNLIPGQPFQCMETILGVAASSQGRQSFLGHVQSRCRRIRRGHDKPYAIYENFGSWPIGEGQGVWDQNTEQAVLHNLNLLAQNQPPKGPAFDYYSIEFWVDRKGDLQRFDPKQFPQGLDNILPEFKKLDMAPGLWIAGTMTFHTIGQNPLVHPCLMYDQGYKGPEWPMLCRATDPIKTLYTSAFKHHIRNNDVRLLKFDGLFSLCHNPHHGHLPGVYSTEAIQSAIIEFLNALDAECPDVFMMLYWGHRSPWWLLHGDTLFEPGLGIEAASPSLSPTLHVRDSVIVGLDQAQAWCQDVPTLCKDSLGVWLSDWWWNSSIGKENWQEAFVMDMCRGGLLAQIWGDHDWLSEPERIQLAELISLLKANPDCFAHPRFILGDPWKFEPYGYCCRDGNKAFIAINNCTWSDRSVTLELNASWSLPDAQSWDIYRRYPNPAKLYAAENAGQENRISLCLRPFEVILLEVVLKDQSPNPPKNFPVETIRRQFVDSTRELDIIIDGMVHGSGKNDPIAISGSVGSPEHTLKITGQLPTCHNGGILAFSVKMSQGDKAKTTPNIRDLLALQGRIEGKEVDCQPAVGNKTYPVCWQTWRIPVMSVSQSQCFELNLDVTIKEKIDVLCRAYFIPSDQNR